MIRVLVFGGRDYSNTPRVFEVLNIIYRTKGISCVIHGGARGADSLAGLWARTYGVSEEPYPAKWRRPDGTVDKSQGFVRNQCMLDEGRPDIGVAFPGGKGTADMAWRCKQAGLEVLTVQG